MEGLADPEAFKACYAQFRKSDNDRDVLITQLLSNYEDLKIRYQSVKNQLEDEKENREIWQRETRDARRQLHQSKLANVSPVSCLCLPCTPSHQIHSSQVTTSKSYRLLWNQTLCLIALEPVLSSLGVARLFIRHRVIFLFPTNSC